MSRPVIVPGDVRNGEFFPDDPRAMSAQLAMWKDGRAVLRLDRPKKKRSNAQNRWLYGCALPIIMDDAGYDRDELRDEELVKQVRYYLLGKCFGTKKDRMGQDVPVFTSSQLSTTQMSDFMEWLPRFAAKEMGVRIPLPDDPIVESLIEHFGVMERAA